MSTVTRPDRSSSATPGAGAAESDPRERGGVLVLRDLAIVLVLAVTIAVFVAWYGWDFLSAGNLADIADSASLTAIFAVGEAVVVMAGRIDLSIAPIAAASGIVAARLLEAGVPSLPALALTLGFGAALGAVNGLLVTKAGLSPLVATLGTLSTYSGLAFILAGGNQIFGVDGFDWLGQHRFGGTLTAPAVVMIGVVVVTAVFLRSTVWGLRLLAVGGNEEAARRCGIRTNAYTIGAFVFSGCAAALAGCIMLGFLTTAEPTAASTAVFDAITAVALGGVVLSGGQGNILRVLAGALVLGVISTGLLLNGVAPYYALVVTGCLLVLAIVLENLLTGAVERRLEKGRRS
ncbi:ABC transporter permease [Kribbella sp. NPDC048915]|uniref:ABC transporter permease n=1 Tax=Kribbella sp. NPDC048915 TaxID=3155148 RepID=UPI0033F1B4CF